MSPEWRALLGEMPERFLVGSDTWINARWDDYEALMQQARRWLGDLPPAAARADRVGERRSPVRPACALARRRAQTSVTTPDAMSYIELTILILPSDSRPARTRLRWRTSCADFKVCVRATASTKA